jgi:hypothetical protein
MLFLQTFFPDFFEFVAEPERNSRLIAPLTKLSDDFDRPPRINHVE